MGSIPLPALAVNPPPNVLDQYAKLAQLKSLLQGQQSQQQQMQERQQSFPSLLQSQQSEAQSAGIDVQMKQIGLKNMQMVQSELADPNLGKNLDNFNKTQGQQSQGGQSAQPDLTGGVQLSPVARYLVSKGLPLLGPNGALEINKMFTSSAQEMATLAKTQGEAGAAHLKNHADQLDNFNDLAAPVLGQTDPIKQIQGLQDLKSKIAADPNSYPQILLQKLGSLNSIQDLTRFANTAKVQSMITEEATKGAQAKVGATEAATPTPQQLQAATQSVQSYQALPQSQRQAFASEMAGAQTFGDLQKIQGRADAAQESFQRSADMRQQAMALKNVAVSETIANKSLAEDHALRASLANSAGIRNELDMSSGGNQVATNAALQRFAEHEVAEGGIKRFNELEQKMLISGVGSYGRQFQSWADKGFSGKPPQATNAEIHSILDNEDQIAQSQHDANIDDITKRYMPIMGGKAAQQANPTGAQSNTAKPQFNVGDSVMYGGKPHKVTAVDPKTGKLTLAP